MSFANSIETGSKGERVNLRDVQMAQDEFDCRYFPRFSTLNRASERNLVPLLFLGVGLSGEVGELNNIVKKLYRGDLALADAKQRLAEELTDAFSYLVKFYNQLGIDIDEAYSSHLAENRERFADRGSADAARHGKGLPFGLSSLSGAETWSASTIAEQVRTAAVERAADEALEMQMRSALNEVGIYSEESPLLFFMSTYLACILDAAAELQSFHLRDQQVAAVDEAAMLLGLNQEHVRVLLRGVSVIRRCLTGKTEGESQS